MYIKVRAIGSIIFSRRWCLHVFTTKLKDHFIDYRHYSAGVSDSFLDNFFICKINQQSEEDANVRAVNDILNDTTDD